VGWIDVTDDVLAEYWLDCTHPDLDGKIGIAAIFTPVEADDTHVRVWLDNNLIGASVTTAMYVMRIDEASYPARGADLRSRFLLDDWIFNPMAQMREVGEMTNRGGHKPICDNTAQRNCLYKKRNKGTPAMSLHTPDWGMLMHTMDPDNADSGYLMLGGALNDDGEPRLDFGYLAQLSDTDIAANGGGIMPISPTLSIRTLPATAPLNDAWWEALDVYREYVETETDLLPVAPLGQDPAFAEWSETCIYNALFVLDDDGVVKVDEITDFFDEMMAFYGELGDPVDICPLAWAALSYAPFEFAPGTQALLDSLKAAAEAYPNVDVHPMFYVDSACAQPSFDAPASAWILDGNDDPILCHDGVAWLIDPSEPVVGDALRGMLPTALDMGFEGVYHDAPFGDYLVTNAGADRRFGEAYRQNIEILAEAMAANDGGVVVIEDGRLGVHAQQSRMASLTYPFFINSSIAPFGAALVHGHHLTGQAGSIADGLWPFLLADAASDGYIAPICADRPRGGTTAFEPGRANNADHIPRHAIFGAVMGGVVHDSQSAHWRPVLGEPDMYAESKKTYVEILRDVSALRNRTPALRRGRMVSPPTTDIQKTEVATRMPTVHPITGADTYTCQLGIRTVPEVELALYEDPDSDSALVLVLGNAMKTSRTVTIDLTTLDHPRLNGGIVNVLDPTGEVVQAPQGGELSVDVPGYSIRVLHLTTP
jgi:hypothetical protein